MIITVLALLCIALMAAALFLNLFSLPANWMVLILAALWTFLAPETAMSLTILALMGALAVAGEILETLMVRIWGKKYGGSTMGTIGGIIGSLIGAIFCAPFLFGIGALFGALFGAFSGALAIELFRGRRNEEALRAAWGAMLGRFGGAMAKTAVGGAMVVMAAPRIWP
jgi:uncharacterized protein YqgC (DUF456 family)